MSLRQNTDPIRMVPAAQRDVWTRPAQRCQYEDGRGHGRGRCQAMNARVTRVGGRIGMMEGLEYRCPRHTP
jgi:hypothetical protein